MFSRFGINTELDKWRDGWQNKSSYGKEKCGGALLLEYPHATVDVFNIINGVGTKQMNVTWED